MRAACEKAAGRGMLPAGTRNRYVPSVKAVSSLPAGRGVGALFHLPSAGRSYRWAMPAAPLPAAIDWRRHPAGWLSRMAKGKRTAEPPPARQKSSSAGISPACRSLLILMLLAALGHGLVLSPG